MSLDQKHFAVMWDCQGLEACEQFTQPAEVTFALLKGEEPRISPNINHWRLRAQFNPQRHYEIYLVVTEPSVDRDDIVAMFEANPQTAADTIRRLGTKFYCNRNTQKPVIA